MARSEWTNTGDASNADDLIVDIERQGLFLKFREAMVFWDLLREGEDVSAAKCWELKDGTGSQAEAQFEENPTERRRQGRAQATVRVGEEPCSAGAQDGEENGHVRLPPCGDIQRGQAFS